MIKPCCACVVALLLPALAFAFDMAGIPQPLNPQRYSECVDLKEAWYAKVRSLEQAVEACTRRDGGAIRAAGIWMPNCRSRQRAYVTCAGEQDQLCLVRNLRDEAFASCNRKVAETLSRAREEQSVAARLERDVRAAQEASNTVRGIADKGVTGYIVDRYAATQESAAATVHDAVREASRTAGTTAPDSQPPVSRAGQATEWAWQQTPYDRVIKEIVQQSGAAARARMSDGLNQMEGSLGGAAAELDEEEAARDFVRKRAITGDLLPPCRPRNSQDPRIMKLPPCRQSR